jgi:hypothetical protein
MKGDANVSTRDELRGDTKSADNADAEDDADTPISVAAASSDD